MPHVGSRDDMNLVPQVIERQQAVEEHQGAVGQLEIILRVIADVFQLADNVVGTKTNRARKERRQARNVGRLVFLKKVLRDLEDVAGSFLAFAPALQDDLATPCLQLHVRAGT